MTSGLVGRHIDFLEALRGAGIPVSLAEDLDAVAALSALPWSDRATVHDAYAATLVKRQLQRPTFDALFDLWFPRLVGRPTGATNVDEEAEEAEDGPSVKDGPGQLAGLRERLAEALTSGDQQSLTDLAVEAVERFGEMPGRAPGLTGWSAYTTLRRVAPAELVDRLVAALLGAGRTDDEARRVAGRRVAAFTALVEGDARRRIAEEKGPGHIADVAVRPSIDRIDFGSARGEELAAMRREVQPLARRLATRLAREQHARRRGPLDVRRTVRASLSSGGVPLTTHHRPRRPHRPDLVVLCDVSGSVASFASFTLLLVMALREQFSALRAFTFVDRVHEVTDVVRPGADPGRVMADLAASSAHAARFGRTNYGRAFTDLLRDHADALGPRTSLLVLGDARSNYSDLALPALRELTRSVRHAWWLNPEHPRHWDTGDSAARPYGEVVPMVECRNLAQLGELVHDLL